MYKQDFYITEPVGNNAFSYESREHKKLFVPALKKIQSFDEIELAFTPPLSQEERKQMQNKITFEDYDFDEKLQTCFGLKNLYEFDTNSLLNPFPWKMKGASKTPVYLVDNHNHVFYFWYLAREYGIISDGAILYHVDEHADMRDPGKYLLKPESQDLQKVFEYTNFFLNVWNFIIPAIQEGLISDVVQIRSEGELMDYNEEKKLNSHFAHTIHPHPNLFLKEKEQTPTDTMVASSFPLGEELWWGVSRENKLWWLPIHKSSIILNLDLDFFEPELDYIDFELKKQVILDIAAKADLITICTSPFFIEQERALKILQDIFG